MNQTAQQFVKFLERNFCGAEKELPAEVALAGSLAMVRLELGHSVTDLSTYMPDSEEILLPKDREGLCRNLQDSPAFQSGQQGSEPPLTLVGSKLFLTRSHKSETLLAQQLRFLSKPQSIQPGPLVMDLVQKLFPRDSQAELQMAGALLPFQSRLVIISGGPGTGKTTLLTKLLLLQFQDAVERALPLPQMALAAPTGKAAQRMAESLAQNMKAIQEFSPLVQHLTVLKPQTLHRLMGLGRSAEPSLPSNLDCIVIDESSMVDLSLFARLVSHLPPKTTLILLGDPYQLSSVEAGTVFSDLCEAFRPNLPGSSHVQLQKSWRFVNHPAIGQLSLGVNTGDLVAIQEVLQNQDSQSTCDLVKFNSSKVLVEFLKLQFQPLLQASTPEQALSIQKELLVLAGVNKGPWGQETLNDALTDLFFRRGAPRPLIITENNPVLDLYNGDIGVIFTTKEGEERAWFPSADSLASPRSFALGALPSHRPAYVITIHKSQGSEATRVICILEGGERILCRELLYTGITRAKAKVTLVGSLEQVLDAAARPVERSSDLVYKLQKND